MKRARRLAEALGEGVGIGGRLGGGANRGGIDQPRAAGQASLEQVQRGAGVLAHGAGGVGRRPARIGDPREVEDGVASGSQLAGARVAGIDEDRVEARRGRSLGSRGAGERHHLVPPLAKQRAQTPAEKAGAACDQELHPSVAGALRDR